MQFVEIPVDEIEVVDGWNPRSHMDQVELDALTESVRSEGILTPVIVANGDGYRLVDGHRRLLAAVAAGLEVVPAVIGGANDDLMVAAVANLRREQLRPVDEAETYQRLLAAGRSESNVAHALGVPRGRIHDRLRLLRLSPEIRRRVNERDIPLAAVPVLERIAQASPVLADRIATEITSDNGNSYSSLDLTEDHRLAVLLDAASSGTSAAKEGALAAPVPGWVSRRDAVRLVGGDHAALIDRADSVRGEWWSFGLDDVDADAARAYGCFIDHPNPGGRIIGWITDPAFYADRVLTGLVGFIDGAEEKQAKDEKFAAAQRAANADREGPEGDDEAARERARVEQEREAAIAKARTDARIRNERLAADLLEAFHKDLPGHVALDATAMICHLALHTLGYDLAAAVATLDPAVETPGRYGVDDEVVDVAHLRVTDAGSINDCLAQTAAMIVAALAHDRAQWSPGATNRTPELAYEDPPACVATTARSVVEGVLRTTNPDAYERAVAAIDEIDPPDESDDADVDGEEA